MKKGKTGLPATQTDWERELALAAQNETAETPAGGGGNWISLKGGVFTYKGDAVGRDMLVVVLAHCRENAYYTADFNPDNRQPPGCFALGFKEDELTPHETSPDRQGAKADGRCTGCWANDFGSGKGRGKACGNRTRLAVIAADDLGALGRDEEVEIAFLRVPPTSMKHWYGYVHKLNRTTKLPSYAVVTRLELEPSNATYILVPKLADNVADPAVFAKLRELNETAREEILVPYDVSGYDPDKAQPRGPGARAQRGSSRATATTAAQSPTKPGRFTGGEKRKF